MQFSDVSDKRQIGLPTSLRRRSAREMEQVSETAMQSDLEATKTIESTDFRVAASNPEAANRANRLREAVKAAGGNKAVVRRSGIPATTLHAYMTGQEWKVSAALALAEACNVTLEWLATGHEPPAQPPMLTIAPSAFSTPQTTLQPTSNYVAVPRYDVRASAGGGSEIVAERLMGYIALDDHFLRTNIGRRREDLVTIEATGESMAPTIRDGSILFVDVGSREIDDGRVYVLSVNDRLLVKRLQLRANGHVVLRSDNPAYPAEEVAPSERNPLHIIGQVVYQAGPVRA